MENIVYIVTIEEIYDMVDYPHKPCVFSTRENALKYLKDTYENVKDEFQGEDYTFNYNENDDVAIIHKEGYWSSDRWVITMTECVVDKEL